MHNLNNAFNTAEQNLGLTRLLDAEGIKSYVFLSTNTPIFTGDFHFYI